MRFGQSSPKLRHVLTITAAGILVLLGVYYLTKPFFPKVSNEILPVKTDRITSRFMTPYWADKRFDKKDPAKDKIMLSTDEPAMIEDIKIVYRGLNRRNQFQLDVFVLNFDPEMAFAHALDIAKAKKGFRLAGKEFQLISAREHRVHLWHHKFQ